jgi:hypothetical protein
MTNEAATHQYSSSAGIWMDSTSGDFQQPFSDFLLLLLLFVYRLSIWNETCTMRGPNWRH